MFPGRGHATRGDGNSSGHRGETAVPTLVSALREAVLAERAALLSGGGLACNGGVTEAFYTLANYATRELRLVEVAWPHR